MKSFTSDNWATVSPEVLEELIKVNQNHAEGYGEDSITNTCIKKVRALLETDAEVFFCSNGTSANVLTLKAMLKNYESVLATDVTHIHTDECGAFEHFVGSKIITFENKNGKLDLEKVKIYLTNWKEILNPIPKVIAITNATERETVYTKEEVKAICDFAHNHNMYVFLDGARIANALVATHTTLKEMTMDAGVDAFTFGGTKIGGMTTDLIVFLNKELATNFKYIQKQGMQLLSKQRYAAAQFNALLTNNLWLENATKANNSALELKTELEKLNVQITSPVQTNAVYTILPKNIIPTLQEQYPFYIWNEEKNEVRLMCSWDTTEEDINSFINLLKQLLQNNL